MKLSELLAKVGDENIQFQNAGHSEFSMRVFGRGDARVSFYTSAHNANAVLMRDMTMFAVYVPTEKLKQVSDSLTP